MSAGALPAATAPTASSVPSARSTTLEPTSASASPSACAAIAERELDDLISTAANRVGDEQRSEPRERLWDGGQPSLRDTALRDDGIDVVGDVASRPHQHPAAVRDAIFDRIRSERAKKAAEYQSEGERLAADIRSASEDGEVAEMKAEAEAKAIACARRRRGGSHPQPGTAGRPGLLRLPQEAGGLSAHPRRRQDDAAALDTSRAVRPAVQLLVDGLPRDPARSPAPPGRESESCHCSVCC